MNSPIQDSTDVTLKPSAQRGRKSQGNITTVALAHKSMAVASFNYTLPITALFPALVTVKYDGLNSVAPEKPTTPPADTLVTTKSLPDNRAVRRAAKFGHIDLEGPGYLRIAEVLSLIPISRASLYAGIKSGIYPAPVKLSVRSVGWSRKSILRLLLDLAEKSLSNTPQSNRKEKLTI